jgi:hypothetical protein
MDIYFIVPCRAGPERPAGGDGRGVRDGLLRARERAAAGRGQQALPPHARGRTHA